MRLTEPITHHGVTLPGWWAEEPADVGGGVGEESEANGLVVQLAYGFAGALPAFDAQTRRREAVVL
ncbi:hypothetical protein M2271_006868 [Streptomyces sp. LBL]|uniref:hypothetical protein n=1 Tax=Streptomyces sp. LBL TaxID=2940562 RepID=UPI0024755857|nr:hypothetical protein [Streptomyces sp. LBL]MDH6629033.1 hypothetical protein [Streptomyces sp. LBL]